MYCTQSAPEFKIFQFSTMMHKWLVYYAIFLCFCGDSEAILTPTGCEQNRENSLSVFIGVKTTTASGYAARAQNILSTWGKNTDGHLALITDGIDPTTNRRFAQNFNSLPIIEIKGFTFYKLLLFHYF
jgi:hypothetical protein